MLRIEKNHVRIKRYVSIGEWIIPNPLRIQEIVSINRERHLVLGRDFFAHSIKTGKLDILNSAPKTSQAPVVPQSWRHIPALPWETISRLYAAGWARFQASGYNSLRQHGDAL